MRIEITRRELAAGLGGLAAAGWIGLPAIASKAAPIPAPPACRSGAITSYILDQVQELHRLACAEWHAEASLLRTGEDGRLWSRLHVMKVDATAKLRGRLGYVAPDERALRVWMDQIYRLRMGALAGYDDQASIGPALRSEAQRFQNGLLRLPMHGPVPDRAAHPLPADLAEHEALLERVKQTAWTILRIAPRTAGDVALHRRAAMFAVDPNVVLYLRSGWAGIEAARLDDASQRQAVA